eukprot:5977501-Pleurochrysis_carterae.AAC.1
MSCLSRALPVPTMLWLHRLSDVNGVWHCITTVSLYRLRTSRLEVASIFRRLFVPFTLFRWPCGPCVSRAPHVSSVLRLRRQGDGYNMCRCTATFVLRFVRIRRFHIISSLCLLSVPFSCLPWTCGSRSSKALPVLTVLWMHRRGDVSSLRHRVTSFALCRSRTRCLHVGVFLCLLFIRSTLLRRTCGPNSSRALHVLAVPCLPLQGQGDVGNMRRCNHLCIPFRSLPDCAADASAKWCEQHVVLRDDVCTMPPMNPPANSRLRLLSSMRSIYITPWSVWALSMLSSFCAGCVAIASAKGREQLKVLRTNMCRVLLKRLQTMGLSAQVGFV